jgi:2-(1,2-epoxy-1,2-dihydrophenyl)acetyl-CoA isomerase
MTEKPVLLEFDGPVARVTFNRPDVLNAVNAELAAGLLDACQTIARTEGVRVVLLRGNGRAFMAGGDVSTFAVEPDKIEQHFRSLMDPVHGAIEIMTSLDQPVIAAVHGSAAGAGLSIALAADIVIASEETKFAMAYARLGISMDGSMSWSLPRLVGLRKALEMALLGDVVKADEALRLGLITKVVSAGALTEETESIVNRLAKGPTIALGRTKRLLRGSHARAMDEQLRAEEAALLECVVTDDFSKGIAAFLGKKDAGFSGR